MIKQCLECGNDFESTGDKHQFCTPACRITYNNRKSRDIIAKSRHGVGEITDIETQPLSRPAPAITEAPVYPSKMLKKKGSMLMALAQQTTSIETLRYMLVNAGSELDSALDVVEKLTTENEKLKTEIDSIENPPPLTGLAGIVDNLKDPNLSALLGQIIQPIMQKITGGAAAPSGGTIAGVLPEGSTPEDMGNLQYIIETLQKQPAEFRYKMAWIVKYVSENPGNMNTVFELLPSQQT